MAMAAGVPASMGRRLLAALVDAGLALLVVGAPMALGVRPVLVDPAAAPAAGWLAAGWVLLLTLAVTQWMLLARRGWTLGKRALGVVVVSERSGFPPGPGAALLRLGVPVLANVVPLLGPALVAVSPFFDRTGRRQGWHDKVAGTVVVDGRLPRAAQPAQVEHRLEHLLRATGTSAGSEDPTGPAPPSSAAPVGPVDDALPDWLEDTGVVRRVPGVDGSSSDGVAVPDATGEPGSPGGHVPGPGLPPSRGLVAGTRVVPQAEVVTSVPVQHQPEDEDVEATRLRPARAKVPELAAQDREVTVELTDGQRVTFAGAALVGRDPAPRPGEDGCRLIRVADPGRSVSKTHLLLGVDRNGLWVRDRRSTNGTVVTLADGQQILCGADQQVRLPPGASVAFGDYGLSVATVDAV
jgi:uncharacterized RDD family membrane protein YckC